MNTRSDFGKRTVRDKFEDLRRIVKEEETLETKPQHTEREFHSKRNNQTVCVTTCQNRCSNVGQNPIILEKSGRRHSEKHFRVEKIEEVQPLGVKSVRQNQVKKVEKYEPVEIPLIQRRAPDLPPKPKNEEKNIQIIIQNDKDDKECLKKLFKKINKLTDQLNDSEKNRIRLEAQLQNFKDFDNRNKSLEKRLRQLETQKHKLHLDLSTVSQKLSLQKAKPPIYIEKVVEKPIEIIKQVPIEKIVEVKVEVPKYIPGPERIVEKVVEVPKYIEVERKVPYEVVKEVIREIPREIIKKVEVPEYIEKPIYIDKPVYIDTPVYIDKEIPVADPLLQAEVGSLINQVKRLEAELERILVQNDTLRLYLSEERLRKPIETPVYIDRLVDNPVEIPIYIDRVVDRPVEIPYEVPVIVDRQVQNSSLERRSVAIQQQMSILVSKNTSLQVQVQSLRAENDSLRLRVNEMYKNMEILKQHNEDKNRKIEELIVTSFEHSSSDRRFPYLPTNNSYSSAYNASYTRPRGF